MEVKKNQDYIVTIEDLSVEGEGIGKISEGELGNENGFPLFIKDTVIGVDVAKVRVIKVKKNYGYGRLIGNHHAIAKSCKAACVLSHVSAAAARSNV